MIRFLALCLFLWIGGVGVATAAIQIKSGEHVDFSRVVIYYDDTVEWELGRIEEGYLLRADNLEDTYDLSTIFDFMPRSRIQDATQRPTGLVLSVSCDCHADAFEYRPGILVLDIKDGPARPGSPFEKGFSADELRLDGGSVTPESSETVAVNESKDVGAAANAQATAAGDGHGTPPETVPVDTLSLPSVRGTALRENLAQALGRAMSQGVVAAPENAVSKLMGEEWVPPKGDESQITFRTATDLLREDIDGEAAQNASGQTCLDRDYFAVGKWGQPPITPGYLGKQRIALASGTSEPSVHDVVTAIHGHLYLGFGAEALQILDNYPVEGPEGEVLRAIARQMDEPGRSASPVLQSQAACDSDAAVWGLLSLNLAAPLPEINSDAVFHTVSSLPLHLREHLAPVVSERLRRVGAADIATAVRASVARTGAHQSDEMVLETSRAEPKNHHASALDAVATGHTSTALEAQKGRLGDPMAAVDLSNPDSRHEIEAQIHVAKGSDEARDLLNTYVAALAHAELFEEAFEYTAYLARSKKAGDLAVKDTFLELMDSLVRDGSDGNFVLAVTERGPKDHPFELSPRLALEIAERLEKLGFAQPAAAYRMLALEHAGPISMSQDAADPNVTDVAHPVEASQHAASDPSADHVVADAHESTPHVSGGAALNAAEHSDQPATGPTPNETGHEAAAAEVSGDVETASQANTLLQLPSSSQAARTGADRGAADFAPIRFPASFTLAAQEELIESSQSFRQQAAALLGEN